MACTGMKQILYDLAFFSALAGVTYKVLDLATRDDTITEIQFEGQESTGQTKHRPVREISSLSHQQASAKFDPSGWPSNQIGSLHTQFSQPGVIAKSRPFGSFVSSLCRV